MISKVSEQLLSVVDQSVSVAIEREKCSGRRGFSPRNLFQGSISVEIKVHAVRSICEIKAMALYVQDNWCPAITTLPGAIGASIGITTRAGLTHASTVRVLRIDVALLALSAIAKQSTTAVTRHNTGIVLLATGDCALEKSRNLFSLID